MEQAIVIIVLVIVALFVFAIAGKRTKGKRGEKYMASLLSRISGEEYRVINDLLIQSNGYSTQIDHVVISIYGIFVIETKYYDGCITGGESNEIWTQNIYGNKYRLRNPLWQNQGHIRTLRRLLDENGKIPFYSIVAFSRQARLRVDSSLPVMYWQQVVPYIRQYSTPVMSESTMNGIYRTLLEANVTDRAAKKKHIKSVRQNQIRRNKAVSSGKCPRCGGDLVLRNGQYGKFYGCSNYPRCKYILK